MKDNKNQGFTMSSSIQEIKKININFTKTNVTPA